MQWSDITRAPTSRMLRQFGALCLVVFGALAAWRLSHGTRDAWTWALLVMSLGVGGLGLIWPQAVRWIFTGWLIVAFPIGWLVSRVVLAVLFFALFTPIALFFRMTGRDVLHRRRKSRTSYWVAKPAPGDVKSYFRQY